MNIYLTLKLTRQPTHCPHKTSRFVFLLSYLFCTTVQAGLSKLLFNINFVEGRPSLVSDLNIVPAILAVSATLAVANDVEEFLLL